MKQESRVFLILWIMAGVLFSLGPILDGSWAMTKGDKTPSALAKPTGMQGLEWYASSTGQIHNIGTLWSCVSNHGVYGNADFQWPNFEWPGGSENHYNWEGRFWCGAVVDGENRVSHADYGNYEFYPSENPSLLFVDANGKTRMGVQYFGGTKARGILDSYVEYDDKTALTGHIPLGIRVQQRGLSWSMPDYDDFLAFEISVINESTKDYEDFYVAWIFDADNCYRDATDANLDDLVDYDGWDGNDSRTDILPDVYPGVEYNRGDIVDPMDWDGDGLTGYDEWGVPYGDPDNPLYNPLLVESDGFPDEYSLIIDEVRGRRIAFLDPADPDGTSEPESVIVKGFAVPRNMSYIYDADLLTSPEQDFQERDQKPYPCDGYIGGRLIYTPKRLPAEGAPHNYSGADYALSDSLMMPYAHTWWNWESDPGSDTEKLEYMKAIHVATKGKRYMVNPHHPDFGAPVFDYRWLESTGPFDFGVGDTLKFVYAGGVGRGLEGLRKNLDMALYAYYQGSLSSDPYHPSAFDEDIHWLLPAPPVSPVLNYSAGDHKVTLVWDNVAEVSPDIKDSELDFRGYKVYRALYKPSGWELIYAYDNLNEPVFVTTTEGDTVNPGNPIDLPSVPFTRTFTDPESLSYDQATGKYLTPWGKAIDPPINGLPYYYAVVAYDYGRVGPPPLEPQESSRSNYKTDPATGAPTGVVPLVYYEEGDETPSVDKVEVVPNPYLGTAVWERQYHDKIMFINLPPVCKISILTLTGDRVFEIYHDASSDYAGTDREPWDLITRNEQSIASGLYLYVVETDTDKKIGKFVVLTAE